MPLHKELDSELSDYGYTLRRRHVGVSPGDTSSDGCSRFMLGVRILGRASLRAADVHVLLRQKSPVENGQTHNKQHAAASNSAAGYQLPSPLLHSHPPTRRC
jgi:hypothetical protein